jgi:hypothetical protein
MPSWSGGSIPGGWLARAATEPTGCGSTAAIARRRAMIRCGYCHRVFNAFTGTILHGTRRRPRELALIVRGFAQGVPTAQLARKLDCDRAELLKLRHRPSQPDRSDRIGWSCRLPRRKRPGCERCDRRRSRSAPPSRM